jgi:creatinine amidohydrolase
VVRRGRYRRSVEAIFVERLSGAELPRAAALPFSLLPLGSLEYHGPHGPFGTDLTLARGFAELLASRRPCLVFPPIAYTFVPRLTRDFGPAASVAPDAFLAYLTEVLRGVLAFGPKRIVLLNAHSENQFALRLAAERVYEAEPEASMLIVNWWKLLPPEEGPRGWGAADGFGHGHGGPIELSVTAAFEPRGVTPAPASADVPYEAPTWRAAAQVVGRGQAPVGFVGYHGRVSAVDPERGRRIAGQVADALARLIDDFLTRADG